MALKNILQSKTGTWLELFLFFLVSILPLKLTIIIPLLACISIGSMKIRKLKWTDVGFAISDFKIKTVVLGILLAFIYFLLFNYLVDPLLNLWFHGPNLDAIGNVKGDIPRLIMWLIASWTIAAIFEEFIFRGYLVSRLADLFGESLASKIFIVLLATIPFGAVHAYQGMQGMITAGLFGAFQSIIYLLKNKKLAIPMIAHGTFDTIGFTRLFLYNIS